MLVWTRKQLDWISWHSLQLVLFLSGCLVELILGSLGGFPGSFLSLRTCVVLRSLCRYAPSSLMLLSPCTPNINYLSLRSIQLSKHSFSYEFESKLSHVASLPILSCIHIQVNGSKLPISVKDKLRLFLYTYMHLSFRNPEHSSGFHCNRIDSKESIRYIKELTKETVYLSTIRNIKERQIRKPQEGQPPTKHLTGELQRPNSPTSSL